MNSRRTRKLPGVLIFVLSVVPGLNWISLVYIGVHNEEVISLICGILYGFMVLIDGRSIPVVWLIGTIQYAITYIVLNYRLHENQLSSSNGPLATGQDVDFEITAVAEQNRVNKPKKRRSSTVDGHVPPPENYVLANFIRDMHTYANRKGSQVDFQTFSTKYYPTYRDMDKHQQAWYFYWRSEIRKGNYLDTDTSYILVHIYELLSGVGCEDLSSGYQQLQRIWSVYRKGHPDLDPYLHEWLLDFALYYNLKYELPEDCLPLIGKHSMQADLLIHEHRADVPLFLPFELIDAICEYRMKDSRLYSDNRVLFEEAISQVVAVVDRSFRERTGKGLLAAYGPTERTEDWRDIFRGALCKGANKRLKVSFYAYTKTDSLVDFMDNLVKYTENVLRRINGYRGRLHSISLDSETCDAINSFLERTNGYELSSSLYLGGDDSTIRRLKNPYELELDFNRISKLREESDLVREALFVDGAGDMDTEGTQWVKDISAEHSSSDYTINRKMLASLVQELPQDGHWLLRSLLADQSGKSFTAADEIVIRSVNVISQSKIGRDLLQVRNGVVLLVGDFRDELNYVLSSQLPEISSKRIFFDASKLGQKLKDFVGELTSDQSEVLSAILNEENPNGHIEEVASRIGTLPMVMIDEINEIAAQSLGDIIIETDEISYQVVAEFYEELKSAIIQ